VEGSWSEGKGYGVMDCLKLCTDKLTKWGGDHFHKFGEQIKHLKRSQLTLHGRRDPASLAEFQRIENQLSRLEAQEDVFWRQRAKQHWLKGADANTRFYHRYASARKKKNMLARLKNANDIWVEGDLMNTVVLAYFDDIFRSRGSVPMDSF